MSRAARALVAAAVTALVAGCAVAYTLEVRNVDAPTVRVLVNGVDVGTVRCRATIVLVAGANAPPLPWKVDLVQEDGQAYDPVDIDGSGGQPKVLAILDVGVVELPPLDPQALEPFEQIPCPAA